MRVAKSMGKLYYSALGMRTLKENLSFSSWLSIQEAIDILNQAFPSDGKNNLPRLLDYTLHNAQVIALYKDDILCGWASYAHKDKMDIIPDAYGNTYMQNISFNTETTKAFMEDNDIYIALIVVSPRSQKQGIGSLLLQHLYEMEGSGKYIYLWADETCNQGFYSALSFEKVMAYETPYGGHSVIFRKKI